MNDQFNEDNIPNQPETGDSGAAPQVSAPMMADAVDDIDISNKSQRVVAILVVIILVAAGIGGFIFYSGKQSKIDALDKLKSDFATEHNSGYEEFWKAAKLDLDVMKTNVDFEAKITEYLSVSSIASNQVAIRQKKEAPAYKVLRPSQCQGYQEHSS